MAKLRMTSLVQALAAAALMSGPASGATVDFTSRDAAWPAGFTLPLAGEGIRAVGRRAGDMLIGGDFSVAGDVLVPHLAAWDGAAWRPLGEGPGAPVRAITSLAIESDPFSRFLVMTDEHERSGGSVVWFTDSTRFDGRVHTNTRLRFAWNPQFGDTVSSVSSTAEFYNDGGVILNLDADHNGTIDVPYFEAGFVRGYRRLPLPVDGYAQEWAVLGLAPHEAQPSNATVRAALGLDSSTATPPNGIHLVTHGGSVVGGIRVQGSADQVRCSADTVRDVLELRITQGSAAVTIRVDPDSQLTTFQLGSGLPQRFSGVPNGTLIVIGGIHDLRGPDRLSGMVRPALPRQAKWNIVVTNDIVIQRDITLHDPGSASNVLGIISTKGNVRIGTSAPSDCQLDAFVMALGTFGEFKVDNYDTGSPRGRFHLKGGVVARHYGSFYTFDLSTGVQRTGYTRDFRHDSRGLVPPYFPRVLGVSPERTVVACARPQGATGLSPTIRLWNGTSWSTIGSSDGEVDALIEWGGKLIAAGDFTTIDGVPAHGIASWDGSSWSAMGAGFPSQHVRALEAFGDTLHAAGDLPGFGHVARWDGEQWTALGLAAPGPVSAMHAGIDGLYVCAHAESVASILRWEGNEWFDTGASGEGSVLGDRIARLLATFGDPPTLQGFNGEQWTPLKGSLAFEASAFHAIGDTAHIAGVGALNGEPVRVVAFDGANWRSVRSSWKPTMTGVLGSIDDAVEWNGSLITAGAWSALGAGDHWSPSGTVGRWTGSAWESLGAQGPARRLFAVEGDLLRASTDRVWRWAGSDWESLGGAIGDVHAITVHHGEAHAVLGSDSSAALPPRLMRWNGTAWTLAGVTLGAADRVRRLVALEDGLYLAGAITEVDGVAVDGVVRWDGVAAEPLGEGPRGEVTALVSHAGGLVVGGRFAAPGEIGTHGAARWDGESWVRMGEGASRIDDLVTLDGQIYAIGSFATGSGTTIDALAAWDGRDWYPLGSGFDRAPERLVAVGSDLYVVGDFTRANGRASRGVAKLPVSSLLNASDRVTSAPDIRIMGSQPSRGPVRLALVLPSSGRTRISLYDVQGRRRESIEDAVLAAGHHELVWDPGTVSRHALRPGMYFITLEHADRQVHTRLVFLR